YSRIYNGDIAILAIVQEEDEMESNSSIGHDAINIYRWDAAEIREEAEHATDVRDNLKRDEKRQMKKEKSQSSKKKTVEYKESIQEQFSEITADDKDDKK